MRRSVTVLVFFGVAVLALTALSRVTVTSLPLPSRVLYSVITLPRFVFSRQPILDVRLYNNSNTAVIFNSGPIHKYTVRAVKSGQVAASEKTDTRSVPSVPEPDRIVPARGFTDIRVALDLSRVRSGRYTATLVPGNLRTGQKFPSAPLEFYYLGF